MPSEDATPVAATVASLHYAIYVFVVSLLLLGVAIVFDLLGDGNTAILCAVGVDVTIGLVLIGRAIKAATASPRLADRH